MSKKFFSLIYGDQVKLAADTKIIPADSFSTLLNASDILSKIQSEAEQYRQQVIKECEQIKENAFKEGYEAGFQEWAQQLVHLEKEVEKAHLESQQSVIPVALKAAKKIVGKEIELSPETIADIVSINLKAVAQHKKITIYVNPGDFQALDKNKGRLRDIFESLESFSIRPREDINPGGCIIETEIGIINAQIEHRWDILEKAFEALIKSSSSSQVGN